MWAEKYEGNLEEVLALQDTVAQDVARSIKINLTPRERTLLATPRAVDPMAYELYLKGRHLWDLKGEENLMKSRQYLEQAIEKDPGYALAWAGLADTYNYLLGWGVLPSQDALPRARAAAEKALELDNGLAGPLVALAGVKMNYEWGLGWRRTVIQAGDRVGSQVRKRPSHICELSSGGGPDAGGCG